MGLFSKKPDVYQMWIDGSNELAFQHLDQLLRRNQADLALEELSKLWNLRACVDLLLYWSQAGSLIQLDERQIDLYGGHLADAEASAKTFRDRAIVSIAKSDYLMTSSSMDFQEVRRCLDLLAEFAKPQSLDLLDERISGLVDLAICGLAVTTLRVNLLADAIDRLVLRGNASLIEGLPAGVQAQYGVAVREKMHSVWLLQAWSVALESSLRHDSSDLRKLSEELVGSVAVPLGFNPTDMREMLLLSSEFTTRPVSALRKFWNRFAGTGSMECLSFFLELRQTLLRTHPDSPGVRFSENHFDFMDEIVRAADFQNRPLYVRGIMLSAWLEAMAENPSFLESRSLALKSVADFAFQNGARDYIRARRALANFYVANSQPQLAADVLEIPFSPSVLDIKSQYFGMYSAPDTQVSTLVAAAEQLRRQ